MTRPLSRRPDDDCDVIVVGAGHNGLITAAYLARAGLDVILVEARSRVGGTAASEPFGGGTVNVCNCDHLTFRTTPVATELDLAAHGLRYLDLDPAQHYLAWSDGTAWTQHHEIEPTLESLGEVLPGEVAGYRRYLADAVPAVRQILDAAAAPPTRSALVRRAVRTRLAGAATLLRWSRRSAADVLRSYFGHDALTGTAAVGGPMVWGVSPEFPATGLGALTHAIRHVGRVGRPIGGSGALPEAIRRSFEAAGGTLLTSTRVETIMCEGGRIRGVRFADGGQRLAPVVVSACDPHRTFLEWLRDPPPSAAALVARWRAMPQDDGYESKLDVIVSQLPVVRALGRTPGSTLTVAPGLDTIDAGYRAMRIGGVLDRPAMLVNVPSLVDPSMAAPGGEVLSLEVLYTPYALTGGWPGSPEPERWLGLLAELCEPGLLDSVVEMRAMTPDVYERDFHLPHGHATSFAGGPLAVFRSKDPELTRYETAVAGLFLTGAATFPGAGVWGASGRNCATVVLDRLGG